MGVGYNTKLWLYTHCSCGVHVTKCKSNISRLVRSQVVQKTGGSNTSTQRYKATRDEMTANGITATGKYGIAYCPETGKHTDIYNDDVNTRKQRLLEVIGHA